MRKLVRVIVLVVCVVCVAALGECRAEAVPSCVVPEGETVIWQIGETRVWRFPAAYTADVMALSEGFNELYARGFTIKDLKVAKENGDWTVFIGGRGLLAAKPEHSVAVRLNPHLMALHWLSKMYEAVGELHAKDLTAAYRLRGHTETTGSVSWYGGKFIGRRFANGERFTESHLACAAKDLPFGTLVRVTTPATGKSVVVRVTDRFKEHKNRLLDLSQAAAEVLGIKRMGVANAKFEIIGRVDNIGGKN